MEDAPQIFSPSQFQSPNIEISRRDSNAADCITRELAEQLLVLASSQSNTPKMTARDLATPGSLAQECVETRSRPSPDEGYRNKRVCLSHDVEHNGLAAGINFERGQLQIPKLSSSPLGSERSSEDDSDAEQQDESNLLQRYPTVMKHLEDGEWLNSSTILAILEPIVLINPETHRLLEVSAKGQDQSAILSALVTSDRPVTPNTVTALVMCNVDQTHWFAIHVKADAKIATIYDSMSGLVKGNHGHFLAKTLQFLGDRSQEKERWRLDLWTVKISNVCTSVLIS